jgi:hypothetical protein
MGKIPLINGQGRGRIENMKLIKVHGNLYPVIRPDRFFPVAPGNK